MDWLGDFADRTTRDEPLAPRTWYRLGGPARYLVRPRDAEDLSRLARRARDEAVPLKVLGGGANVLISDDGFDGVVVLLDAPAFTDTQVRGDEIEVGAGVDLMPFSRSCSHRGLAGLECMAGIPGTVGGAVRMNAGGPSGTFGDVVEKVDLVTGAGTRETWDRNRLGFGYRHSAIRDEVVVSAALRLRRSDAAAVRDRYEQMFAEKRRAQPIAEKSAGCVFKNPPGASAGALIDRAGLKGTACGRAHVSPRHANFIVAEAGATAEDVRRLIEFVRDRVRQVHGTELALEIDLW